MVAGLDTQFKQIQEKQQHEQRQTTTKILLTITITKANLEWLSRSEEIVESLNIQGNTKRDSHVLYIRHIHYSVVL